MTNLLEELTEPEQQLVEDFARKYADVGDRLPEEPLMLGDDVDMTTVHAAFEQVMALVSEGEELETITLRAMTLSRLEAEIDSKLGSIIKPSEDLPPDAVVTREKLNRMLVRDELTNYFLLAGSMIEHFTIELVIQEVGTEKRQSETHRSRVEQMSEMKREDLLHMAGVLDDGEKGEVRRAYRIRNNLAHSIDPTAVTEMDNIENDIERTREVLDMLHEKIRGIPLDYRITDILVDDEK